MIADSKTLAQQFQPKEMQVLQPDRQLCTVRFRPDGRSLYAGGYDSRIWRWDLSGKEPKELPSWDNGGGWVQCLEFAPKGDVLFAADSWGALQAWQPQAKAPRRLWTQKEAHDGWIHGMAVSPDGKRLATAGLDGAVRLWSAAEGALLRQLRNRGPEAFAVAFHPQEQVVVSGDLRGTVQQWNVTTGKKQRTFDASVLFKEHRLQDVGGARVLAFDEKGTRLFVAGTKPKNGGNVQGIPTILVFDWKTGQLQRTLELGKTSDVYVTALCWHPAGFLLAGVSGNPGVGKVVFIRPEEDKPFYTNTKTRNCHAICLHPQKKRFVATATNNGSNGNGRPLKNGEYVGNYSPVHLFDFPAAG